MSVEVTARHMDATAALQDYARRKADGLMADFPIVESVHVILDVQKHRHIAELVIQAKHRHRSEAEETADNMKAAIDAAVEKSERQLSRLRDKIQDHKAAMRHTESEKARGL
ncbi:MAG: ribosome-associated translation inhibitor RaiA [Verrucomicrobia bacterium]|nr:ribosome-associated translation inhibitor RaiA [Verrucomicrobiota bacterium]